MVAWSAKDGNTLQEGKPLWQDGRFEETWIESESNE